MGNIVDRCTEFFSSRADDTWGWLNSLHREEWMVLLAITAAAGFLLMLLNNTRAG